MGGMLPSVAMSAMQIASNASQARAAAKQTDTQLSQENAQISQQADAQVRQAQQNQAIDQNDRSERLRRALATQTARFGAQGIDASGGSADAMLSGMQAENDRQNVEQQAVTSSKIANIESQADWQQRRNLLGAAKPSYGSAFSLMKLGLRSISLLGDQ